MERLTDEKISKELNELTNWKRLDEKWLEGTYRFKDYLTGIDFVQKAANYSEEINHHPFIAIEYKKITVKLSSWKAKGITDLDISMARKFNEFYEEIKSRK